jgi:hypothetical protein
MLHRAWRAAIVPRQTGVTLKPLAFISGFALATVIVMAPASAQAGQDGIEGPALTSDLLVAEAQQQPSNVPAPAQQAEGAVERTVRRFRIGVEGGVALDPELIIFGAHGAFGPVFTRSVEFRPGFEFGVGEITTLFGINLDVLYTLPGSRTAAWAPYAGAGPNFALSHRGFDSADADTGDTGNRFDFSDTSFNGGFNFLAGVRSRKGAFLELKATAYGTSMVRLLAGFNF